MFNYNDLLAFIKASRETATDAVALKAKELYKSWKAEELVDGVKKPVSYKVGDRRTFVYPDGELKLIKCRQAHTAEAHFTPDLIPALWEVINETHSGTIEDPIPYDPNMEVFENLYYVYADVLYKCTRNSGQPLYNTPDNLIGHYFEVV